MFFLSLPLCPTSDCLSATPPPGRDGWNPLSHTQTLISRPRPLSSVSPRLLVRPSLKVTTPPCLPSGRGGIDVREATEPPLLQVPESTRCLTTVHLTLSGLCRVRVPSGSSTSVRGQGQRYRHALHQGSPSRQLSSSTF